MFANGRDLRAERTVGALARSGALIVDLYAEEASLATAGARAGARSILLAADQLAEWEIAVSLRPLSVRGLELAVAGLLEAVGSELDAGWRGACTACGQPLRIAAWRWASAAADTGASAAADTGASARPIGRRATCAACKGLSQRGDASAMQPGEAATQVQLSADQLNELREALGTEAEWRWTPRQLGVFLAMRRALARSSASAPARVALRAAMTRAVIGCARPHLRERSRPWWEIAPWQALANVVNEQRRALLMAEALPRDLSLSADLENLSYAGRPVILMRAGATARTSVVGLATSAALNASLLHLKLCTAVEERTTRAQASALTGGGEALNDPPQESEDARDARAITAAIARTVVAVGALIKNGTSLLLELPATLEALAGVLTAVSMAGGIITEIERCADDRGREWWWIVASLPPAAGRRGRSGTSLERQALTPDALQRIVTEILMTRGEPTAPEHLLLLYVLHRSAGGGLLESTALMDEFNALLSMRAQLRPLGSLDQLVSTSDRRIFVNGPEERKRIARNGGDRDDLAYWAAAAAGQPTGRTADEDPRLAAALRAAYYAEDERGTSPRWSAGDRTVERLTVIAQLLSVGAAMGLHTAVAPPLASVIVNGLPLSRQVARDPIDPSPPLRLRSDRDAFDQIDALLFRRGMSLLMCEVLLGPLPLGALLLERHAKVATDREVVRLLVTDRALLPLVALRLQRDQRIATAWELGNWHLLATDQLARLAALSAPRLADLERYLGSAPLERERGSQLDLASFGWGESGAN